MSHFGLLLSLAVLLYLWGRAILRSRPKKPARPVQEGVWGRAPTVNNLFARNASDTVSSYKPQTEVHMNPISALIFIVFIGGAVLARLANMPIAVTIVLA